MQNIAITNEGNGAGHFLQKLDECRKMKSTAIVYSYINQDVCPAGAHVFGNTTKTSRGQTTFDIHGIYVPEEMRRVGVGRRLYAMIEDDVKDRARRSACDGVMMRAEAGSAGFMQGSRDFWRGVGFKECSIWGAESVSISMEKFIRVENL